MKSSSAHWLQKGGRLPYFQLCSLSTVSIKGRLAYIFFCKRKSAFLPHVKYLDHAADLEFNHSVGKS